MSLETHIIVALSLILLIVALSLTLLILLFVIWKDRRECRENEERLIQETLGTLQTEISRLKNLVERLQQDNRTGALRAELSHQLEVMRQALTTDNQLKDNHIDILRAEIFRLEVVRWGLVKGNQLDYSQPPELSQDNPYWRDLSRWMRIEREWTCEKCGINLAEKQCYLHVHHIFGRGFNSPQHLKVLCIACHAEEPYHEFMRDHQEYKAFLKWRGN